MRGLAGAACDLGAIKRSAPPRNAPKCELFQKVTSLNAFAQVKSDPRATPVPKQCRPLFCSLAQPSTAVFQLLACMRDLLSLSRRDKTTVAQQFIAGIERIRQLSPGGTAEGPD